MSDRIWDLPVRLSHWVLAAAVATCWWTGEEGLMDIHQVSGYVVLGTVLFRILWGFLGSESARFLRFPLSRIFAYLRTIGRREPGQWPGHNPAGAFMVLFMLAYFGLQAGLGLFTSDDILVEGPLVARASSDVVEFAGDLHHELGEFVPVVIGLHVLAVLFYLLWKRQNLIAAMVTGRREAGPTAPALASTARGAAIAITVALAVTTLVQWGRQAGF